MPPIVDAANIANRTDGQDPDIVSIFASSVGTPTSRTIYTFGGDVTPQETSAPTFTIRVRYNGGAVPVGALAEQPAVTSNYSQAFRAVFGDVDPNSTSAFDPGDYQPWSLLMMPQFVLTTNCPQPLASRGLRYSERFRNHDRGRAFYCRGTRPRTASPDGNTGCCGGSGCVLVVVPWRPSLCIAAVGTRVVRHSSRRPVRQWG